jgi:hypothetical protein
MRPIPTYRIYWETENLKGYTKDVYVARRALQIQEALKACGFKVRIVEERVSS